LKWGVNNVHIVAVVHQNVYGGITEYSAPLMMRKKLIDFSRFDARTSLILFH
jgi:hypothetical protein